MTGQGGVGQVQAADAQRAVDAAPEHRRKRRYSPWSRRGPEWYIRSTTANGAAACTEFSTVRHEYDTSLREAAGHRIL